jgi:hypothetical protein
LRPESHYALRKTTFIRPIGTTNKEEHSMPKAVIFASRNGDTRPYTEALRRVRCKDPRRIHSPDDISTDTPADFAVVEIFDLDQARIGNPHLADDKSPGVRVLKAIRERWPRCVILAISHTSCINGSNYVEGSLLADRCIAIHWGDEKDPALNPGALATSGLRRASEAHPLVFAFRRKRDGADSNALPVAS